MNVMKRDTTLPPDRASESYHVKIPAKEVLLLIMLLLPMVGFAQPEPPSQSALEGSEMILFQNIPSVSGASKYEQELKEAPSFVSIVTAQDIKRFGYRTLADILRGVTGFFTTYDRNYHFVGARGFARPGDYNTRVLPLVDGHGVNDSIYDQAPMGTDFILDGDLIERVEVIRGPSSSLYGANAFLGVINVITRKGRDLKGTELSGEAGSFGTYKGRASYGNRFQNGLEMIASGTGFTSSGQDLFFKEFNHPGTNRADAGVDRGSHGPGRQDGSPSGEDARGDGGPGRPYARYRHSATLDKHSESPILERRKPRQKQRQWRERRTPKHIRPRNT